MLVDQLKIVFVLLEMQLEMGEALFCFIAVEVKNSTVEVVTNWQLSNRFLDPLKLRSNFCEAIVEKGVVVEWIGEEKHVVNLQSSHVVSISRKRGEVKVSGFVADRKGLPAKLLSF